MPQPTDILFTAMSSMTGGLVTDLTTAMLGMLVLGFIVFGFDHLKDLFENSIAERNRDYHYEKAKIYHAKPSEIPTA